MLTLDLFQYTLPPELIAQTPLRQRDTSRLLDLNSETGEIVHRHFYDLEQLLGENDVIIRNNTRVIPARIFGTKDTGGACELLLVKRREVSAESEVWECLSKPTLKVGQVVTLSPTLHARCEALEGYVRVMRFSQSGHALFSAFEAIGHTPLPPYIRWNKDDESELRHLYQTTYAKVTGSAAAPTAGLHFTPDLDARLTARGVQIHEVTLHVGLGTFLPVKTTDITQHHMHSEWFELSPETAAALNQAKKAGKRLIAVGTTTTRVLESSAQEDGTLVAQKGETQIFIYPPYRFKAVEALITNYHESRSTLLMLVSALCSQPNTSQAFTDFAHSHVGKAYQEAIAQQYRFHSFGDAMFIHPPRI